MTDDQRLDLLRRLHRGQTSRNREFGRFADPEARRVLRAYRRVRSLLRELARPGVRAGARWSTNPGGLDVAVECPRLRYRRVVVLAPWEARFLLAETDGALSPDAPARHPLPDA